MPVAHQSHGLSKARALRQRRLRRRPGHRCGRTAVACRKTDVGEELWYFQCKRYEKISAADLIPEVDKIYALETRPAGIVIATSAGPTTDTRDRVSKHCSGKSYACEIWGRSELDLYTAELALGLFESHRWEPVDCSDPAYG